MTIIDCDAHLNNYHEPKVHVAIGDTPDLGMVAGISCFVYRAHDLRELAEELRAGDRTSGRDAAIRTG
jgi:hypothetical protein